MNKYSDKSDYEINKAVAVNINGTDAVLEKFGRIYISDGDRGAMVSFSPCNNPADAMPIIIENSISLIKEDDHYIAASTDVGVEGYIGSPELMLYGLGWLSKDKNPYRAAMEVLLMMKDAENEK